MKPPLLAVLIFAVATPGAAVLSPRANGADAAANTHATVVDVCATCHGKNGNSTDPSVPSLAGQGSAYLANQLAGFQAQRRVGVMSGVAMSLTDSDIRDAATYFSQQMLRASPIETADSSALRRGRAIYDDGIASINVPACASCHALDGAGLPSAFPRLAGQHSRYIAAQLRAFRSDGRLSTNRMMQNISAKLSDEEIGAVADYIAGLQTDHERDRMGGR